MRRDKREGWLQLILRQGLKYITGIDLKYITDINAYRYYLLRSRWSRCRVVRSGEERRSEDEAGGAERVTRGLAQWTCAALVSCGVWRVSVG